MIDAANLKFFGRKPCKISIVCLACFLLLGIPKACGAQVTASVDSYLADVVYRLRGSDGAVLLSFLGLPFASHRVLAANDPAKPAWVQLGTSFADRVGEFGFTDTIVTGTLQRFYRGVSP